MKRVINLLKNRIDDLDFYLKSSYKKDNSAVKNEILQLKKAIKILEDSERKQSTEIPNNSDSK